ncbi:MAG: group II intron reverse transcriptase/maturase [Gemmataceae bacterium]
MNTDLGQMYGWETLPWLTIEAGVFKLQGRIYQASADGDSKKVRSLQKLLLNNRAAKLLAVRRVTQDNRGKNTAGVDGISSLTPEERLLLADNLKVGEKASPVRRVYIPKAGSEELRPLGIPTIHDRALQALVRLALEPEWEARFEANSYGFRPGRSCWDAIEAIFRSISTKAKFVLDADIAKCFDRINHEALLKKVNAGPAVTRQLRAWLKAGILDGKTLFPSEEGTPQGGTISPLLANIALHGLETLIEQRFPKRSECARDGGKSNTVVVFRKPQVIRYADDFVVLHVDEAVVRECQEVIAGWLKEMGLELKPSKTRICHTLHATDGQAGFDFLGFAVRQFPVGKTKSGQNTRKEPLGFKTLIKPSKTAVKRHVASLREVIDRFKNAPQEALIGALNPVIRGWSNYFSIGVSSSTLHKIDHVLTQMLMHWAYRRHPNKNRGWIVRKYWRIEEGEGWTFRPASRDLTLCQHKDVHIRRHIKVQSSRSPFDGDWVYWSSRLGRFPGIFPFIATLLKRQTGMCKRCGAYFKHGDEMVVDHVRPSPERGPDIRSSNHLLHRHCYQEKRTEDRPRGMRDNAPDNRGAE